MDLLGELVRDFLLVVHEPPYSGVFIAIISVTISTISNLAMKRFADMRRLRRYQLEIKQYQELQRKAQETQNEKLLRKVRRRKAYIDRIQKEMMTSRCKPYMIFFIPFIAIFTLLRGFYTNADGTPSVVAVIPFNVHKLIPLTAFGAGIPTAAGFGMFFWSFYFLMGLGLSSVLQRAMGTQLM